MVLPVYFFPNSTLKAQAASSAVWATSNIAVPIWTEKAAYTFDGTNFTPLTLPAGATDHAANPNATRTGHGYFSVAADGTQGLWMAADGGLLAYLPYPNTASGFVVDLDPTEAIMGLIVTGSASSGNTAVAVNASGNVILSSSTHPGVAAVISPGFNALSRGATADSTNLYTTKPAAGLLGIMSLAGRSFSNVSTPMTFPGILAASSAGVAVGGWSYASVASGIVAFADSPLSPSIAAVMASATEVALLTGSDPNWIVSSTATGIATIADVAWNPDGSQVLATTATGTTVYRIVSGNLSLSQNLHPGGACTNISVTEDGSNALACIPSLNQIGVFVNTLDIWSVGTPFSLASPTAVLTTSSTSGWALSGTGIYPLRRSGNVWSAGTPLSLGFNGQALGADAYGNVFATGGTGTSGYLALVASGNIQDTLSWSGAGYGISLAFSFGQVGVLLSDGLTIRAFGATNNVLYSDGVMPLQAPSGSVAIGSTPYSVFLCGGSQLWQCQWGRPNTIYRYKVGEISLYNGASWGSAILGISHDPSALAWDASGNIWASTAENDLYSFSGTVASGNIEQLSYEIIPDYSGQVTGTILGLSSLTWFSGILYATTLFAGAVVKLGALTANLVNNGGFIGVIYGYPASFSEQVYPVSDTGLMAGAVWDNGDFVSIVPGITPNPLAPAVFYGSITGAQLLALGGGNLPLSDPHVVNQLWNNGGFVCVSSG